MNPLYYIEFTDAQGEFFTSKYGRYANIDDLVFDLQPYFKRFPGHNATWRILAED